MQTFNFILSCEYLVSEKKNISVKADTEQEALDKLKDLVKGRKRAIHAIDSTEEVKVGDSFGDDFGCYLGEFYDRNNINAWEVYTEDYDYLTGERD